MKNAFKAAVLFSLSYVALGPIAHAGDLGVGVTIRGEIVPGVYGRVNLGAGGPPPVVYARPVTIEPASVEVAPLYLHVPPEHARDWRHHCHEYHACNQPVYFVRSREYDPDYRRRPQSERRREEEAARAREIERAHVYDREHEHGFARDHDDNHGQEHHQRDHEDHDHDRDHDH